MWDSAVVDQEGRFVFENVPAGFEWHFRTETNIPDHREPRSRKFTLAREDEIRTVSVVLELKADQKKVDLRFSQSGERAQDEVESADHHVTIEGTVVDFETGEIIRQGVIIQGGLQKGGEIAWGHSEQRGGPGKENGNFSTVMNVGRGDRARVIVDGYLPKPIFEAPPKFASDVTTVQRSIVLRRGREVSGRVLHHDGRPMVGASVFAVGPARMNLYDGKAWRANGNEDDIEERFFRPVKTDEDGRFSGLHLSGTNRVAVSSLWLDAWPAKIADNRDRVEIRLPQAAGLGIDCCVPGGDSWEVQVYYQFLTPYMSDGELWKNVSSDRTFTTPMGRTDLVRMPPGHYQIMRRKLAPMGDVAYPIALERQFVHLEPGAAPEIDWYHKDRGARVKSTVHWPENETLTGVMYRITSRTPNKDFGGLEVANDLDGGVVNLETGKLYSSPIPAGDYVLTIEAQRPVSPERLRISSPIFPDFTKSIEITVPELNGKEFVIDDVAIFDE